MHPLQERTVGIIVTQWAIAVTLLAGGMNNIFREGGGGGKCRRCLFKGEKRCDCSVLYYKKEKELQVQRTLFRRGECCIPFSKGSLAREGAVQHIFCKRMFIYMLPQHIFFKEVGEDRRINKFEERSWSEEDGDRFLLSNNLLLK